MTKSGAPSRAGMAATDLVLAVFALNGALIAAGDALVRDLGISSARWQVLGAVGLSGEPQTVSGIARAMGLTRQSVQRLVNEMRAEGLVAISPNPHHARAGLVVLTPKGSQIFAQASARQIPWINQLAQGIAPAAIGEATRLLSSLTQRLTEPPTEGVSS